MCGIAGILSYDPNCVTKERLHKMTTAIQHRGPESDGFWINEGNTVGFGHRRLSIIDLSPAGAQPMNYLDRFTITYNGEIYNYIEIKVELERKGYTFYSHCDTEVILAAYAYYGKDCTGYFDGMFAFAIWDNKENTLFCARDRFGEKPFYYSYSIITNDFVFGSEMKALWAGGIPKKMSNEMLLNYLTLGWVQSSVNKEQTFFEDICSLPPSHYLLYKFQQGEQPILEIKSYFDLDKVTQSDYKEEQAIEKITELFTTSIKRRLRSDVAVGSSLSGGLDSSSIVALINSLSGGSNKQRTFSAIFPGFEKDESKQIEEVTSKFGIESFTTTPTAGDFIKDFQKLIYHQEEPFQSSSIYAQYKVYQLAKEKGVTVILDGQGADEILAGYTKYYHWYWQELIAQNQWAKLKSEIAAAKSNGQKVPWSIKNYIAGFLPQVAANQLEKKAYRQQKLNTDITEDFIHSSSDRSSIYKPAITGLNDILYYNTMQFGLEELLRYADRNSMAHSREVRLPFLNHELVQFIFSLPSGYKICNGFTKYVLRKSMEQILPASIVWRKDKVGFEPPQKEWMQNQKVVDYIQESRRALVNKGILKKDMLDKPIRAQSAHHAANFDWRYMCLLECM